MIVIKERCAVGSVVALFVQVSLRVVDKRIRQGVVQMNFRYAIEFIVCILRGESVRVGDGGKTPVGVICVGRKRGRADLRFQRTVPCVVGKVVLRRSAGDLDQLSVCVVGIQHRAESRACDRRKAVHGDCVAVDVCACVPLRIGDLCGRARCAVVIVSDRLSTRVGSMNGFLPVVSVNSRKVSTYTI